MRTFELTPLKRKSFYGKAKVLQTPEGHLYLDSYNTKVATYTKDGTFEITKNEDHLTNITLRHIRAFQSYIGMKPQTKQELLNN